MSTGHYELQKVRNGHFLFHLKGNNGETILHSETFSSKASAENAITFARYVAPDETNYELKQNSDDAAYFVLRGKNQQIIGHSDPYIRSRRQNRVSGQQWPSPSPWKSRI